MSLELNCGSKPDGLTVKSQDYTNPGGVVAIYVRGRLDLVDIELSNEAFCEFIADVLWPKKDPNSDMVHLFNPDADGKQVLLSKHDFIWLVHYFFTNTNVNRGDPRFGLIRRACDDAGLEPEKYRKIVAWIASLKKTEGFPAMYDGEMVLTERLDSDIRDLE